MYYHGDSLFFVSFLFPSAAATVMVGNYYFGCYGTQEIVAAVYASLVFAEIMVTQENDGGIPTHTNITPQHPLPLFLMCMFGSNKK